MRRWLKKAFLPVLQREIGQSLLVIVFAITTMVSVAALVTDLGTAYVRAAQTQTAVDAAVLAAGMSLPVKVGDTTAIAATTAVAKSYLTKNGVSDTTQATVTLGDSSGGVYNSIYVDQPALVETAFARIFGVDTITFHRDARAKIVTCTALSDLVPLSIQKSILEEIIANGKSQHAILKYGQKDENVDNGAFGAIDLDGVKGGGANDYTNWLANGYEAKLTVGTVLPIEPGNMTGPTYAGIVSRYNACTHYPSEGGCKITKYVDDCPRVMKIAVIEYTDSSHKYVRIMGFAAFVLEDYSTYADKGCVIGSYANMVNVGSADGDLTGTVPPFGVYSLVLTD